MMLLIEVLVLVVQANPSSDLSPNLLPFPLLDAGRQMRPQSKIIIIIKLN